MTRLAPRTVLDIGACGGELAEREILPSFPDAQIHCFEPHPANFVRLARVADRHHRIHAHRFALGDSAGQVEMKYNTGSPSSSSLRAQTEEAVELFPRLAETVTEMVEQQTLDAWYAGQGDRLHGPLVIKMDVQAFEDRVIAGGTQTFRKADGVVLEVCQSPLYEGQPSFASLYESLTGLGFCFAGTRDQYFSPESELVYFDACFLRVPG